MFLKLQSFVIEGWGRVFSESSEFSELSELSESSEFSELSQFSQILRYFFAKSSRNCAVSSSPSSELLTHISYARLSPQLVSQ